MKDILAYISIVSLLSFQFGCQEAYVVDISDIQIDTIRSGYSVCDDYKTKAYSYNTEKTHSSLKGVYLQNIKVGTAVCEGDTVGFIKYQKPFSQALHNRDNESIPAKEPLNTDVKLPVVAKVKGYLVDQIEGDEVVRLGDELFTIEITSGNLLHLSAENLNYNPDKNSLVFIYKGREVYKGQFMKRDKDVLVLMVSEEDKRKLKDCNVSVMFNTPPKAQLLVSKCAISCKSGSCWVFKVEGDVAVHTNVQYRAKNSEDVEIIRGLKENDQIIVSSSKPIWDKYQIKIKRKK